MSKAAGESEAFIGGGKRAEPKGKCAAFCHFLYNSDEGTFLGRTPLSWLEITVFYIIFYAGLVGFWAGCLAIFLQTIDYKVPTWYGKGTIIGVNPEESSVARQVVVGGMAKKFCVRSCRRMHRNAQSAFKTQTAKRRWKTAKAQAKARKDNANKVAAK